MNQIHHNQFDGDDYQPDRDDARLSSQIQRVFDKMKDGEWHTLSEVSAATGDPEASISAQLRHLRKERFGSHIVNRQYKTAGFYEYRLLISKDGIGPVVYPENDDEWYESEVEAVEGKDGRYSIRHHKILLFGLPAPIRWKPKPGMKVRLYGKGIGHEVRGLFINGRQIFYKQKGK